MGPVPAAWLRSTRRGFLLSGAATLGFAATQHNTLPAEWHRYSDPATEFELFRLTDPAHACFLPPYYARALSRHNDFLIYASDRGGAFQAYRMDLHTGESRPLTSAAGFDHTAFSLLPDDRGMCFFEGDTLGLLNLRTERQREVYRVPAGWERCPGLSISDDGLYAVFGEKRDQASRLRMVRLRNGNVRMLTDAPFVLSDPIPRPRRDQVLYRQEDQALWLVNHDGQQRRKLKTAPGRIGPADWAPTGRTVLYLNFPEDQTQLTAIRELTPDQNLDKLVARTSQYEHFGFNLDTSVFVGASRNRASPYVLILLRLTRRELSICEHHASNPAMVAPIFSADSQWIYFQSDRDGQPALYRIRVDKLVEKTNAEEA